METFTTKIDDFSAYKFAEDLIGEYTIADVDITNIDCKVVWNVEFDMRERGIRSIDTFVVNVVCEFDWSFVDDEMTHEETDLALSKGGVKDGDYIVGKFELNCTEWEIESRIEVQEGGYCQPNSVELDFMKKVITIE